MESEKKDEVELCECNCGCRELATTEDPYSGTPLCEYCLENTVKLPDGETACAAATFSCVYCKKEICAADCEEGAYSDGGWSLLCPKCREVVGRYYEGRDYKYDDMISKDEIGLPRHRECDDGDVVVHTRAIAWAEELVESEFGGTENFEEPDENGDEIVFSPTDETFNSEVETYDGDGLREAFLAGDVVGLINHDVTPDGYVSTYYRIEGAAPARGDFVEVPADGLDAVIEKLLAAQEGMATDIEDGERVTTDYITVESPELYD